MASSMGGAIWCLASKRVYGEVLDVDEVETLEPQAVAEKFPKDDDEVIVLRELLGYRLRLESLDFIHIQDLSVNPFRGQTPNCATHGTCHEREGGPSHLLSLSRRPPPPQA